MMQRKLGRREFVSCCATGFLLGKAVAQSSWVSLIQGNTLDGWRTEGTAAWSVENGVIVGRQGPGGSAGDLFSVQQWSDFELEAEWKMIWPGNSGIWFRYTGPKTGYQADFLDQPTHPGVLPGSLYCAGKVFIAENRDPNTVRKDAWNKLQVKAVGEEIEIVLNGTKVVQMRDRTFPGPGSIGIQVHAGKQFEGMEVRIRNFRLRPL